MVEQVKIFNGFSGNVEAEMNAWLRANPKKKRLGYAIGGGSIDVCFGMIVYEDNNALVEKKILNSLEAKSSGVRSQR
jgi:hypothetical protein